MLLSSRRDNSPEFIYKALWFHRALFFCLSANYLARTEVDKGQAFVIRTKNNTQLFLRLHRRPHSSRRDNFDLGSNTKNAQLTLGIFYYIFENNYDCPKASYQFRLATPSYNALSGSLKQQRQSYHNFCQRQNHNTCEASS